MRVKTPDPKSYLPHDDAKKISRKLNHEEQLASPPRERWKYSVEQRGIYSVIAIHDTGNHLIGYL